MKISLVGGAVRDRLLGLPVKEHDWVVEGTTVEEMLAAGFRRADADFPVFLHPDTGEEYALARTEQKTGSGYKGFVVDADSSITLKQDLARRDLTINAIAEDEQGQLTDYFDGQGDLKRRVLRHITPAFEEDPVRVLRVARFAARLGSLGFMVAPETQALMSKMSASSDFKALKPERFWLEMCKALETDQPWRFFEVLYKCGALAVLIPELDSAIKKGDKTSGPLISLKNVVAQSCNRAVRFASVMYGAVAEAECSNDVYSHLRAERCCVELLDMLVRQGPVFASAKNLSAQGLLELLEKTRAQQQTERFQNFMLACTAVWPVEAVVAIRRLTLALEATIQVTPKTLLAEGFNGQALGDELAYRRVQAIQSKIDR